MVSNQNGSRRIRSNIGSTFYFKLGIGNALV